MQDDDDDDDLDDEKVLNLDGDDGRLCVPQKMCPWFLLSCRRCLGRGLGLSGDAC